jgi:hypothetical protein
LGVGTLVKQKGLFNVGIQPARVGGCNDSLEDIY